MAATQQSQGQLRHDRQGCFQQPPPALRLDKHPERTDGICWATSEHPGHAIRSHSLHKPAVADCRALICFSACLSSTEKASASLYVVSVRLLKVAVNVFLLPNFWAVCRQGNQAGWEGFVEGKVNARHAPHHPSPHSPLPAVFFQNSCGGMPTVWQAHARPTSLQLDSPVPPMES